MASKNLGAARILPFTPGAEVIGSAPRIPAVAPSDSFPQSGASGINPLAYDGDEGGIRRFSEDLASTDGRGGAIPSVRPSMAETRRFSEDLGSSADNGGHIPTA